MRYAVGIGIIGGGPAGARAGELPADVGASVVMFDPKTSGDARDGHACGHAARVA